VAPAAGSEGITQPLVAPASEQAYSIPYLQAQEHACVGAHAIVYLPPRQTESTAAIDQVCESCVAVLVVACVCSSVMPFAQPPPAPPPLHGQCPHCGVALEPGKPFCTSCGTRVA
jgi:hypothetical protein